MSNHCALVGRPKRWMKCARRGAALVESALATTVFLMLTFGIIDFGRMIYSYNSVSHLAREATRYASVRGNSSGHPASASDVTQAVRNRAVGLNLSLLSVTTTWQPSNAPGDTVRVTVSYDFRPAVPLVPAAYRNLRSTSRMVISQ